MEDMGETDMDQVCNCALSVEKALGERILHCRSEDKVLAE